MADKPKIELINHPEACEGSEVYRTIFIVEVLSDKPVADLDLADIAHEINEGDSSGRVEVRDSREVSKHDMAKLLDHQGSDPSFILGDDAWKYGLHPGDQVTWNDPDDDACSRTIIIGTIEYVADDTVKITDRDGSELECPITELI